MFRLEPKVIPDSPGGYFPPATVAMSVTNDSVERTLLILMHD